MTDEVKLSHTGQAMVNDMREAAMTQTPLQRFNLLVEGPEGQHFITPYPEPDGDWCRAGDVAALELECARLREALKEQRRQKP